VAEVIPLLRAESDIQRIYNRLEQTNTDRGELFLTSVDRCFALLAAFPRLGAPIDQGFRRLLVRNHPYGIIYREESSRVIVLAVVPLRQDPNKLRAILDNPES